VEGLARRWEKVGGGGGAAAGGRSAREKVVGGVEGRGDAARAGALGGGRRSGAAAGRRRAVRSARKKVGGGVEGRGERRRARHGRRSGAARGFGGRDPSSIFGGRGQLFAKADTERAQIKELLEGGFCSFLGFLLFFFTDTRLDRGAVGDGKI